MLICVALLGGSLLAGFEWEGRVRRLADELEWGDVSRRREVVRRLGTYPASLVEDAIDQALEDADASVRAEAARVAGRAEIRTAIPRLLELLGDPAAEVRARAAETLGALRETRALALLIRGLGDADVSVRQAAIGALASLGGPEVTVPLLGRLDDDDASVRVTAATALGTLEDPQAVVPLIGRSRDPMPEVRGAALSALGNLSDDRAVGAIRQGLRDSDEEVQLAAVRAAGALRSEQLIDDLQALLGSPHARRHRSVLTALGAIGGERGVDALIDALQRSRTRSAAVDVLSRCPEADSGRVVGALAAAYQRPGGPGRDTAIAETLEQLAERYPTREASPALVEALRTSRGTTASVVRALAATGDPDALVPLLVRLPDADDRTTTNLLSALELLFERAPPDGRAADPLLAILGDVSPANRIRVVRLLGRLGSGQATPALLPLLRHEDRGLRQAAAQALGSLGSLETATRLLDLLDDRDAEFRFEAANALGRVAQVDHVRELVRRLRGRRATDRHAILLALGAALSRLQEDDSIPSELARDALDALGRAAMSRDRALAARALDAAGRWAAPPVQRLLLGLLSQGSTWRRRTAARHLTRAARSETSDEVASALIAAMSRGTPLTVRAAATASLGEYGPDHVGRLLSLVEDGAFPVDAAAAFAVARIARRGGLPETIETGRLCRLARHRGPFVRANLAMTLASRGVARCEEGPDPADWLNPQHAAAVRAAAAVWLGTIHDDEGNDPDIRRRARRVLARCAERELTANVRERCVNPNPPELDADADVYVYGGDGETLLLDRLVALRFADGTVLVTYSDANGHVRWPHVANGPVILTDPFAARLEPR